MNVNKCISIQVAITLNIKLKYRTGVKKVIAWVNFFNTLSLGEVEAVKKSCKVTEIESK